jgi:hypothetical protein
MKTAMAAWRESIAPAGPALLRDTLGLAGFASFIYGSWLAYPPAGFLMAGLMLMSVALMLSRTPAQEG